MGRILAGPGSYNHNGEAALSSSNWMNIPRTTELAWIRGYIDGREDYSTPQLSNPTTLTKMNNSLQGPTPNRHLSSSIMKKNRRLRPFLTTGRGMAEGSSWWNGKGTQITRIVGNQWKDLKTRWTWFRHGGRTTCPGRNYQLFSPVILGSVWLVLTMVMSSTRRSRRWIWLSGNPIWTPTMLARRFRFLCFMCEMMFSFCFQGVTGTVYCLVRSIVWYLVCFMIWFDIHEVLCLVSSIVWYLVCFKIVSDTQYVLFIVFQDIVWYLICFM